MEGLKVESRCDQDVNSNSTPALRHVSALTFRGAPRDPGSKRESRVPRMWARATAGVMMPALIES
jgi:hypothetical protein